MPELGFVETPPALACVLALNTLQQGRNGRILYPGVGRGRIRDAVQEVADSRAVSFTEEVGVDVDPARIAEFHARYDDAATVRLLERDFLSHPPEGSFEYIVMNPPYIRYSSIPRPEREVYARRYETATGRFNTYMVFLEVAYSLLTPDGVLTAVIPANWLYSTHKAFIEWVYRHSPHVVFPVPPDIFEAKVEPVVINLYGPTHQPDRPGFNLTEPHPYDVMDLEDACTFDEAYWAWLDGLRRCTRELADELPDRSAFTGNGDLVVRDRGRQCGLGQFA